MLSGLSLDGKSFFYENPLEVDPALHRRHPSQKSGGGWHSPEHFPAMTRAEVFDCSCCPPNVTRLLASIGGYIYGKDGDTYIIHQYAGNETEYEGARIVQETNYPIDGKVKITTGNVKRLALRIPGWCGEFTIDAPYKLENGYAYIENPETVKVEFKMEPALMRSHPSVQANAGRTALTYGPLVYCLEGADNGPLLRNVMVNAYLETEVEYDDYFGANVIYTEGFRVKETASLYSIRGDGVEVVPARLEFIPYYAFANRGESEMIVWFDI
jgi:DUF1680 family protein